MEKIYDAARGYAVIKAQGAQVTRLLDLCALNSIEFWGARPLGELELELRVKLSDAQRVLAMEEQSRCQLELLRRRGAPVKLGQAARRYALWVLPLLTLALLGLLSLFVWQIDVTGNVQVTETEILNALEQSGVYIGSFHPSYTSDSIRSRLLTRLPRLKWAGISVFGSRVVVDVRERTEIPEVFDRTLPVKLVAQYPGIIEQIQVFQGSCAFIKGQTVAKGETLISGAVPSTFDKTQIVHARGSVMARTWHEISAVMPMKYARKEHISGAKGRWALEIGDSRINFYSNSGILQPRCDNIINRYTLGVEGLFSLPISLIKETSLPYELTEGTYDTDSVKAVLEQSVTEELSRRLGEDGQTVSAEISFSPAGELMTATLRAECIQDIAAQRDMTADEINTVDISNKAMEEEHTR